VSNIPYLLSCLIFLPLLAGALIVWLREDVADGWERPAALTVATINAALSLLLFVGGRQTSAGMEVLAFEEKLGWLPQLGISYHLRVDGLSVFLVSLVAWLTPVAIMASWRLIRERQGLYYGLILLFSGGMLGALCSLDLFLFYVFWEIMLVPAFFLIGLYGGTRRREATIKFVIYTMVGSLLMLVGIVSVAHQHFLLHGQWSFDLTKLYGLQYGADGGVWLFLSFALAFVIKSALFPFHTWLPLTYDEAPAPVTFMLSALMAKLGIYGLLRIALPLFPVAAKAVAPALVGLAVCGVVYAGFIALAQTSAKRVLAYASISHLGVILLGVFSLNPQAISGATFHMVAHALTTGALFLLVGIIYERVGTTEFESLGGIAHKAPFLATVMLIVVLASVGLPGLCGFVGEFLVFVGAFGLAPTATAFAVSSVVLGASYTLWMQQRVLFGPARADCAVKDLSGREAIMVVPIVLLVFGLGVFPQAMLDRINPATGAYLSRMGVNAWQAQPTPAVRTLTTKTSGTQPHGHK